MGSVQGEPAGLDTRYLDGLRGMSALAVALFHATVFVGPTGTVERDLPWVHAVARHGDLGVTVFIVLSGYVLMLPVAARRDLRLPGGGIGFIRRRARRIGGPYLAALLLTLLLIVSVPAMQRPSGTAWDTKVPVTWDAIVAHVLLVQDVSPDWLYRINGPMWSVAVEWHLYLLMVFLLLPAWRRLGGLWVTFLALAPPVLATVLGITGYPHPWFAGCFTLGMLAAEATVEGRTRPLLRWLLLLGASAWLVAQGGAADRLVWVTEVLLGILVASWLPWLSARQRPVRWLSEGPVASLGVMSYSIYLLHAPILALANLGLGRLGLSAFPALAIMVLLVVPLVLCAARAFHVLVERRFLTSHQHRLAQAARVSTHPHESQSGRSATPSWVGRSR